MKISVITIAYQAEEYITRTIKSILAQESGDYELEYIIVDGASTDRTISIAESYRKEVEQKGIEYRIISEKDQGIYDAMNKGIRLACGDIIGILNSGDTYEPCALSEVAKAFAGGDCELMFANVRLIRKDGSTVVKKARVRRFQTSRDWNHPTTFVRSALYKENPFPMLGVHDDYAFYLKMYKQGRKIVTIPVLLANFYLGGASNERNWKAIKQRIRDRYRYCYRINGYSRWYLFECIFIEMIKMILA